MNVNKLISQLKHAAKHHRPIAHASTATQLGQDMVIVVKNVGHAHPAAPTKQGMLPAKYSKAKHPVHSKPHKAAKKAAHAKGPKKRATKSTGERIRALRTIPDDRLRSAAQTFLKSPLIAIYAGDRAGLLHSWEGWAGQRGPAVRTIFDEVIATHRSAKL